MLSTHSCTQNMKNTCSYVIVDPNTCRNSVWYHAACSASQIALIVLRLTSVIILSKPYAHHQFCILTSISFVEFFPDSFFHRTSTVTAIDSRRISTIHTNMTAPVAEPTEITSRVGNKNQHYYKVIAC